MLIDLRDILIIVTWKEIFVSILVGYFVSYNYEKIQESIEIKLNNDQKQVKITRFLTFVTAFSVITKHCKKKSFYGPTNLESFEIFHGLTFTNFTSVCHFCIPWKGQKTRVFLVFSGGIEIVIKDRNL